MSTANDFPSDPELLHALDEAMRLQDEGRFDAEEFTRRFPDQAEFVLGKLELMAALLEPTVTPIGTVLQSGAKSLTGRRLGDFELEEEIGRGGMGVVHAARQRSLDRRVAVKLLPPAFGANADLRRRFEREAAAAARLSHPAVVKVHAFGEEDATLYLAMERVDGASLAEVLGRLRSRNVVGGPRLEDFLDILRTSAPGSSPSGDSPSSAPIDVGARGFRGYLDRIVEIGATMADALDTAHGAGLIHRDVKPGNILLDREGRPHLTDFGLVRGVDFQEITRSGQLLGTPGFLAPEAIRHAKTGSAADVFSLGCVLYESLTLRTPFPGDSPDQVVHRVLLHDPSPLDRVDPRIPRDLSNVVMKALEKEPGRRYATAGEVRDDLRRFASGDPVRASHVGPIGRMARQARRRPLLAALIAGLAAALIVAAVGALDLLERRSEDRRLARTKLAEGRAFMASGKIEAARVAFRQAEELDPGLSAARAGRADATRRLACAERERAYRALVTRVFGRYTLRTTVPKSLQDRIRRWMEDGGDPDRGRFLLAVSAIANREFEALGARVATIESFDSVDSIWLRGVALTREGKKAEAARCMQAARAREPASLEEYLIAIQLALRPLDVVRAEELLRQARERWPDLAYLPFKHGHLHALKGDHRRALDLVNVAFQLDPECLETRLLAADLYARVAEPERAIEEFDAILEQDPDNAQAIGARANTLFWKRKREEAFASIEKALERMPGNPHLLRTRGRLRQFSRRFDEAIADYRAAEKALPHSCAVDLARALFISSRNEEAGALVERALRSGVVGEVTSAQLLVARAESHPPGPIRSKDLRRALEFVRDPKIVFALGESCFAEGLYAEAVQLFSEAFESGYARPLAVAFRGACRWMLLDPERARVDLDKGLEEIPNLRFARNHDWPYAYRAHLAASLGEFGDAIRYMREAIARSDQKGYRMMLLGWLIEQNDVGRVRESVKDLGLDPPQKAMVRAWLFARQGRYDRASRELRKYRSVPQVPSPLPWLAILWAGNDELPESTRTMGRALFERRAAPEAVAAELPSAEGRIDRLCMEWVAGRLHLARGEAGRALSFLEEAAEGLDWRAVKVDLGVALILNGNEQKALELWERKSRRKVSLALAVQAMIRYGVKPTHRAVVRWLGSGVNQ